MKFCWCTLMVKDLEASLKFYQDVVGLELDRRFQAGPNGEIAFLGKEGTQIELIGGNRTETDMGKDISLGFEVQSLEEKMSLVRGMGIEVQGPFQPGPMIRFFYVTDPDGTKIQFVQNL